jgi:uncharacterized protein (TIGR02611 family)
MSLISTITNIVKKHGKRAGIFVVGWIIVLAGVAMLVLPGPGLLVVIAGLSVLGIEFAWAAKLRDQAKDKAKAATEKAKSAMRR